MISIGETDEQQMLMALCIMSVEIGTDMVQTDSEKLFEKGHSKSVWPHHDLYRDLIKKILFFQLDIQYKSQHFIHIKSRSSLKWDVIVHALFDTITERTRMNNHMHVIFKLSVLGGDSGANLHCSHLLS